MLAVVTARAQKILDEALRLPKDERHELIEALAESLDLSWSEIRADVDAQLQGE